MSMNVIAFGMILVVILVIAIVMGRKDGIKGVYKADNSKSKSGDSIFEEYDERQKIARGKAADLGFTTLIIGLAVMFMAFQFDEIKLPVTVSVATFVVLMLGIEVYILYAIFHDAYLGLHNKNKSNTYGIMLFLVGALNLAAGIIDIQKGMAFTDGRFDQINLFLGAGFLLNGIALFLKNRIEKKHSCMDED